MTEKDASSDQTNTNRKYRGYNHYISRDKRTIRLAGYTIGFTSCPNYVEQQFSEFLCDPVAKPDISLSVPTEILKNKRIAVITNYLTDDLFAQMCQELFRRRAVCIHASAFRFRGRAVLVLGKSGSGKSTLARLFRESYPDEVVMINDDHPILRFDEDEIIVCDSPWKGKHRLGTNIEVPLERILLLEKSDRNCVRPVPKKEALSALITAFEYQPKDAQESEILFEMLARLFEKCTIERCSFSISKESAHTLHAALTSRTEGKGGSDPAQSRGKRPDISVIIPVWNPGEERMRQCLQSLVSQTEPALEFIFVDDGGTDASMDLVRGVAAADPRIRILTNPCNLGAGKSRNRAIEEASGRYLSFIDADDYVEEKFFSEMYQVAAEQDADIVKPLRLDYLELDDGSAQLFNTDREYVNWIIHQREEGVPLPLLFMQNHTGTLFSGRLTDDPTVRFGETVCSHDITFLLRAGKNARNFFFADKAHYCYRFRKDSISSRTDERRLCDQLSALREQLDILDAVGVRTDMFYHAVYIRIRMILQLQLKLCAFGMTEPADRLLSELRDIVMARMDWEELCRRYFEIDILCRYEKNLCKTPDFTQTFAQTAAVRIQMMKEWASFAEEHPEERRALEAEYVRLMKESEFFFARAIACGRDGDFSVMDFLHEIETYRKRSRLEGMTERKGEDL